MADNELSIKISADAEAAIQGVSDAHSQIVASVQQATDDAGTKWQGLGDAIASSVEKGTSEANRRMAESQAHIEKAKDAAGLLGKVLGVDVPEGLQKIAAGSKTLGAALEAAFSTVAVIALLQVVAELADKVSKFFADTFIYTEKMKQEQAQLDALNKEFVDSANRRAANEAELFRITHTASQNAKNDLDQAIAKRNATAQAITNESNAIVEEKKKLETLREEWGRPANEEGVIPIANLKAHIQDMENRSDALKKKLLADTAEFILVTEKFSQAARQDAERDKADRDRHRQDAQAATQAFQQKQMKAFTDGLQAKQDALDAFHTLSKQDEANYWTEMLKQTKRGSENEKQVRHLMVEAQKAADREALKVRQDTANKAVEKILNAVREEVNTTEAGSQERIRAEQQLLDLTELLYGKESEEFAKQKAIMLAAQHQYDDKRRQDNKHSAEEQRKDDEIGLREQIDDSKAVYQQEEQSYHQLFETHQITKQQEIAMIAAAKQRELAQERIFVEAIEALWAGEPRKFAEIQRELNRIILEGQTVQTKAVTDGLKAQQEQYKKTVATMQSAFDSFTKGLLTGHQTLKQAWTNLVTDMETKFIESLERRLFAAIEHNLMQVAVNAQANVTIVASNAAAAAASKSINLSQALASIQASAAAAAAKVWHAEAGLGPVIAALLAAGAYTAVLAFGALAGGGASAAGGQWEVPGIQPTILHPQEMVLPADLAGRMRNVIDLGGGVTLASQLQSALGGFARMNSGLQGAISSGSGGGGGSITVVVNHSVSAVDAQSFQGTLKRHSNIIGNEVARILKQKGFGSK